MSVSACLFLILAGLLWGYALRVERSVIRSAAESMKFYMASLLEEAHLAAGEVDKMTLITCTDPARERLNNIAAHYPHLYSLSIIYPGGARCSSLTPRTVYENHLPPRDYHKTGLFLYQHPGSEDAQLLMVRWFPAPAGGGTEVAVNGYFFRNQLRALSRGHFLVLQAGDVQLDAQQGGHMALPLSPDMRSLPGTPQPFRIYYDATPGLSPGELVKHYPSGLIASLFISILAGMACHRLIVQSHSPYRNLSRAIKGEEIRTVYQPVVNSATGHIVGYEALCRWQHAGNMIPPAAFIPLAEQSGLIVTLTQHQIGQITDDLNELASLTGHPFYISVNFSRRHCISEQFLDDCMRFMKVATPLQIKLVVEITEREPLTLSPSLVQRFRMLRGAGGLLSLDDFGTGNSNLAYISLLSPDYLKIDKLFVSHMTPENTVLVDCVTDMAGKLGIHVIAEGIENEQQARYLQERGVISQQGFYWYRPVDMPSLRETLKAGGL